ncbi:hypothetical protein CSW50_05030 [Thermus scotoductus]|uniref:Uncharacterized protein n=1 Tax=Thermus scotoductus TaxID=37636 RepID=A0A430R7W6_THESC|nr:hypothetical protein [Thermus scotoductus]RTH03444.1 hypothetical protein CSW50_05030 [Thermus scotoductus]
MEAIGERNRTVRLTGGVLVFNPELTENEYYELLGLLPMLQAALEEGEEVTLEEAYARLRAPLWDRMRVERLVEKLKELRPPVLGVLVDLWKVTFPIPWEEEGFDLREWTSKTWEEIKRTAPRPLRVYFSAEWPKERRSISGIYGKRLG